MLETPIRFSPADVALLRAIDVIQFKTHAGLHYWHEVNAGQILASIADRVETLVPTVCRHGSHEPCPGEESEAIYAAINYIRDGVGYHAAHDAIPALTRLAARLSHD